MRKQVLQHPNPSFRQGILGSISIEEVPVTSRNPSITARRRCGYSLNRGFDGGTSTRSTSLSPLAEIVNGTYSEEEQKRAIVAMSRIGGTAAGLALRKIFMQQKNVDLRCVAAKALERGDETAKPLLEKEAKKILSRESRLVHRGSQTPRSKQTQSKK